MAVTWTVYQLAHAQAVAGTLLQKGGAKSAMDTLELRNALTPLVGPVAACVIAAWVGGAPPKASQEWVDQRKPAEKECPDNEKWAGLSYRFTVAEAMAKLKEQDAQLAHSVSMIGTSKEVKAETNFHQNAKDDADEIYKEIKAATAVGGGVTLVVVAIAAGVYLYLLKKG